MSGRGKKRKKWGKEGTGGQKGTGWGITYAEGRKCRGDRDRVRKVESMSSACILHRQGVREYWGEGEVAESLRRVSHICKKRGRQSRMRSLIYGWRLVEGGVGKEKEKGGQRTRLSQLKRTSRRARMV